ncbi:hypothetical protein CP8484711_0178A, partial [Chlamydia psittaci 84-8471/1]
MNKIKVGIEETPYCSAGAGLSSIFTFPMSTEGTSAARLSNTGVSILQGPHHSA